MKFLGLEGFVSTVAGNGSAALVDGTGTAAFLGHPLGLRFDSQGNLYFVEFSNHTIRKISTQGVVTTLAGNGTLGYQDGTGKQAMFYSPLDVVIDSHGDLIISDSKNHRIRKVTTQGVATTLAGNGSTSYADGTGTAAMINNPSGLAIDAQDNIYFGECGGHRIRKITPGGVVSTLAGNGSAGYLDGTGTNAVINAPFGLYLDPQGSLYFAERGNNRIRKMSPSGVVTTFAGCGVAGFLDGLGTSSAFKSPEGIIGDSNGTFYVADRQGNRIRKISPNGWVTTLAGNGGTTSEDGTGVNGGVYDPYGLAIDSQGNLYVSQPQAHCIRKIQ
jgi:sugar lactone lactonase YvrE